MRKALELDPLSPMLHTVLGNAYLIARQFDQTIEQCRNALELNPHYTGAHVTLGSALCMKGRFDEGIKAIETGAQFYRRIPSLMGMLGFTYGLAGRTGEAQKVLAELQDLAQKAYVSPFQFARIYIGLGEIDRALDWLETAVEEHDSMVFLLPVLPLPDPLRSHPRFHALLRKMNLPE
jgi:tetratricopeptide (TPR) repeat protein